MPFEEISHTADWALRVWADDLAGLLTESARGMWMLANAEQAEGPRVRRELSLNASDAEGLLVAFLTELLYLSEFEKIIFNRFIALHTSTSSVQGVEGFNLKVMMEGGALRSIEKEIKAVTFHNLQIRETERGLEVEIVFDV